MARDKKKQMAAVLRYQASPKGQRARRRYMNKPDVRRRRNRYSKLWRKNHPALVRQINKKSNHQRQYGEPYEEKEKRLRNQNHRCANPGCRTKNPGSRGWQTDHNHETGKVRGELCSGCNKAIGFLRDDPRRAEGLMVYLLRHD